MLHVLREYNFLRVLVPIKLANDVLDVVALTIKVVQLGNLIILKLLLDESDAAQVVCNVTIVVVLILARFTDKM